MRSIMLITSIIVTLLELSQNASANLPDLYIYENRNIYVGETYNQLRCYGDSVVNMYGGAGINGVFAFDNSRLSVYGGAAGYFLISDDTSIVDVYEGNFQSIASQTAGKMTLRGGTVYDYIFVNHLAELNVYKISLGDEFGYLSATDDTIVNIYGYDFSYTSLTPTSKGTLTGKWGDGSSFSLDFGDAGTYYDHVVLHQVPEPCTLLLLGLGGILIRKR